MSDLIVIGFDAIDEATAALTECKALEKEYLLDLEDAVVVVRDAAGKIHLQQSVNLEKVGASYGLFSGGFWGALVGLLFLNPLAGFVAGSVVGAGTGALAGSMTDYGIDDKFIKSLGATIPVNTSALFVLVRKSQPDKVLADLSQFKGHARVLQTSLSPADEGKLRAALGDVAAKATTAA